MNIPSILLALAVAASAADSPLDKKALADHVRASYNIPDALQIEPGDPQDCGVEAFQRLSLKMSMGGEEQVENLYISRDRRFYFLGEFRDLRTHPYAERMSKMDIKDVAPRGKADAPVVVAEFTDFECFYCRKGYELMRNKIMKEYPDKVRWVYKSLPLKSIHPWAEPAAIAAECARRQGQDRFWKLHDAIFEAQPDVTPANFEEKLQEFAKASGLEMEKFNACYDKKEGLPAVQRDMKEAAALGIQSTPSFIVNGRLVPGADYARVKAAIDGFLQKKEK